MREIVTDRLILNNFCADDTESLYELIVDYMRLPTYRYDHAWPETPAEYEHIAKWFSSGDDYLAVRERTQSIFIGFVNLVKEEKENRYNLGFVFNSKYRNKGYAFEACQSYLSYLRSRHGEVEFVTGTSKENILAHKLLLKLGFIVTKEWSGAFQRDESNNPIEFDGYEYTSK